MAFNHDHFAEIFIKKSSTKYQIAQELAAFLSLENTYKGGSHVRLPDYSLHCHENQYNSVPSVYSSANIDSDYFDIRMVFQPETEDLEKNVDFIKKILNFYWEQSIPAAIFSHELEKHLPWLGGNNISEVFWKDVNFPADKFIELCKSHIDWKYVLEN